MSARAKTRSTAAFAGLGSDFGVDFIGWRNLGKKGADSRLRGVGRRPVTLSTRLDSSRQNS